jgi:biopolymer transport protein ExbD
MIGHRRRRRHVRPPEEMNITAFMNLMVILVPFLLITAVFSRVAILELTLPSESIASEPPEQGLQLEITVRARHIEIADAGGAPVIIASKSGEYDFRSLSDALQRVKARFPDHTAATLLLEQDVSYDTLVQVMDAVRAARRVQAAAVVKTELFPDISIGDAPADTGSGG